MLGLGVLLAGASYYLMAWGQAPLVYGIVAALVSLAECAVVGVVLAGKRALAMALVHAVGSQRMGGLAVRLIFKRVIDELLRAAPGPRGPSGAVRGWLRARLVRAVGRYTLARFREEGATEGG